MLFVAVLTSSHRTNVPPNLRHFHRSVIFDFNSGRLHSIFVYFSHSNRRLCALRNHTSFSRPICDPSVMIYVRLRQYGLTSGTAFCRHSHQFVFYAKKLALTRNCFCFLRLNLVKFGLATVGKSGRHCIYEFSIIIQSTYYLRFNPD